MSSETAIDDPVIALMLRLWKERFGPVRGRRKAGRRGCPPAAADHGCGLRVANDNRPVNELKLGRLADEAERL